MFILLFSHIFRRVIYGRQTAVILEDVTHNTGGEKRYYCLGKVGDGILTMWFTYREDRIRILGAGYWRKGKQIYEEQNQIH